MSFASDFAKIQRKFDDNTDIIGRKIKLDLFSSVIKDTRVGNPSLWQNPPPPGYTGGRMRGNWQISEAYPITTEIDRIDPTGGAAISDVNSKVTAFSLSYLTNNVPYVAEYEEKDAMVARNVVRFKRFVRDAARNLK